MRRLAIVLLLLLWPAVGNAQAGKNDLLKATLEIFNGMRTECVTKVAMPTLIRARVADGTWVISKGNKSPACIHGIESATSEIVPKINQDLALMALAAQQERSRGLSLLTEEELRTILTALREPIVAKFYLGERGEKAMCLMLVELAAEVPWRNPQTRVELDILTRKLKDELNEASSRISENDLNNLLLTVQPAVAALSKSQPLTTGFMLAAQAHVTASVQQELAARHNTISAACRVE